MDYAYLTNLTTIEQLRMLDDFVSVLNNLSGRAAMVENPEETPAVKQKFMETLYKLEMTHRQYVFLYDRLEAKLSEMFPPENQETVPETPPGPDPATDPVHPDKTPLPPNPDEPPPLVGV